MGHPLSSDRTTWSNGLAWTGLDQTAWAATDEVAALSARLGVRADDYADNVYGATRLTTATFYPYVPGTNWVGVAGGIIGTNQAGRVSNDVDFHAFSTSGGTVVASVSTARYGANLAPRLQLWQMQTFGFRSYAFQRPVLIATSDTGVLSRTLAAGTYYVSVSGQGALPGDSNYGNLGQYSLSVAASVTYQALTNTSLTRTLGTQSLDSPLLTESPTMASDPIRRSGGYSLSGSAMSSPSGAPGSYGAAGQAMSASLLAISQQTGNRLLAELGREAAVGVQVGTRYGL
jgi:hypothetical protein